MTDKSTVKTTDKSTVETSEIFKTFTSNNEGKYLYTVCLGSVPCVYDMFCEVEKHHTISKMHYELIRSYPYSECLIETDCDPFKMANIIEQIDDSEEVMDTFLIITHIEKALRGAPELGRAWHSFDEYGEAVAQNIREQSARQ